jgi:hypothetical protein
MENKPKWLVNLLDFVFDNIIAIITIGFAMYLVIRQEVWQESFSTNQLLAAVIMVLGLLATSEILERYRKLRDIDRDNKRMLELIESRYSDRPSALTFFQKPTNLDPYFQNGQQIDVCGVTLTTTINKQFANIRTQLKRGAHVRIIVIDPDPASFATSMAAARSVGVDDKSFNETITLADPLPTAYLPSGCSFA